MYVTRWSVAHTQHAGIEHLTLQTRWLMQQTQGLMHSHQVQPTPVQNCVNTDTSMPSGMPKSTSAFNGQLIHGILQFTMIIALCCTLHQHVNQDICCWKCVVRWITYLSTIKQNSNAINTMTAAPTKAQRPTEHWHDTSPSANHHNRCLITRMILPQVHLRKPCYEFSFL